MIAVTTAGSARRTAAGLGTVMNLRRITRLVAVLTNVVFSETLKDGFLLLLVSSKIGRPLRHSLRSIGRSGIARELESSKHV